MSSGSPRGTSSMSPTSRARRLEEALALQPSMPSPGLRVQRVHQPASRHSNARSTLYPPFLSTNPIPLSIGNFTPSATHRSASASTSPSAPSNRPSSRSMSSFTPRIVGAPPPAVDADASTTPSWPAPSPSPASGVPGSPARVRRASSSAVSLVQRTVSTPVIPPPTSVPPPSQTASFIRPSYLENSSMRYFLQSEAKPSPPPDRYRFDSFVQTEAKPPSFPLPKRQNMTRSPARDDSEDSDASMGPPEQVITARKKPEPESSRMRLPTRWSAKARCTSLSVSPDGRDLTFHSMRPHTEKEEAAAARTDYPMVPACGIYYYEIEVLNRGQRGYIGVGFGSPSVSLSKLPGWELHSWGYHGDDGNSFASQRDGSPYGPKYTTADVVGCGVDFVTGKAFFTKNGRFISSVFDHLDKMGDLYPTVGLKSLNESIRANFGQEAFKFDIHSHVAQQRNIMWATIQSTPVAFSGSRFHRASEPADDAVHGKLNEILLAYMTHHGYSKSAERFQKELERKRVLEAVAKRSLERRHLMDEETDAEERDETAVAMAMSIDPEPGTGPTDVITRQRIVRSIAIGDIDMALEQTQVHYPSVLERQEGLTLFKLRCRKFVELALESAAALKRVKEEEARGKKKATESNGDPSLMEVDENAASRPAPAQKETCPARIAYQTALTTVISYGQTLRSDYKSDPRPEVQTIFKKTFGIVAYDDPLGGNEQGVPSEVRMIAGQAARELLAEEVNKAILESQGRPVLPALEKLYRQAQVCVMQLGWSGVGAAAFVDMPREFLDVDG